MKDEALEINKLHKVQYEILLEFDRVCKKYGLTYFLAFGTLLGAIRHNGFIPWDDDIDTMMPYDDYLKLNTIPKSEWSYPFFYQSSETDPDYRKCFSKLRNSMTTLITDGTCEMDINQGVDIDIYPVVHLSDNRKERKWQYRKTMFYMLFQENTPPRNHGKVMYWGSKILLDLIPERIKKSAKKKLLKDITAYQNITTKDAYIICGNVEIMRQVLKNNWFADSVPHTFESQEFPVPIGYHEWLSSRYGTNYMQLPPKEMQGMKLSQFIKIDLEKPYTEYKGIYYCNEKLKRKKATDNRWHDYS